MLQVAFFALSNVKWIRLSLRSIQNVEEQDSAWQKDFVVAAKVASF